MRIPHSYLVVIFPILIQNVHGANETVTYGWRSEPQGRGTWSILWSCLATIFLCTWSSLHLKISRQHGQWYLLKRRVRWMLWVALAPEIMVYYSARDFFKARAARIYLQQLGQTGWTQTHCHFAANGGFQERGEDGVSDLRIDRIYSLAREGKLRQPPISEDELKSRSKTDWIAKLITIIQTVWFVVQIIFRAADHLDITILEFLTTAFVLCTIFTYGFCFSVPQNVEYPIVLQTFEVEKAITQDLSRSNLSEINSNRDGVGSPGSPLGAEESTAGLPSSDNERPNTLLQNTHYPTMLEPQKIKEASVEIAPTTQKTVKSIGSDDGKGLANFFRKIKDEEVGDQMQDDHYPGKSTVIFRYALIALLVCGFGAIHCLAWNSAFPTPGERLAWRICSLITVASPILSMGMFVTCCGALCPEETEARLCCCIGSCFSIPLLLVVYTAARIAIVILAFISLRRLPPDAFVTVDWSKYFPHFAS